MEEFTHAEWEGEVGVEAGQEHEEGRDKVVDGGSPGAGEPAVRIDSHRHVNISIYYLFFVCDMQMEADRGLRK